MKSILMPLTLFLLLAACTKNTAIECKAAAIPQCVCPTVYVPVCGCDGKTYGNECEAKCAGLTGWTPGKCP